MLFVPPGIPFMVPEAEAQSSDVDLVWTGTYDHSKYTSGLRSTGDTWSNPSNLFWAGTSVVFFDDAIKNVGGATASGWSGTMVTAKITRSDGVVWFDGPMTGGDLGNEFLSMQTKWVSKGYGDDPIPSNFPIGTYTFTATIDPDNQLAESDETNNVFTTTFEVLAPPTVPVITVPSDLTYVTNNATEIGMGGASYYYGATSMITEYASPENQNTNSFGSITVSGTSWVSCNPLPGSFFPSGTTTVTCTATNYSGHTGTASFTVTVILEESGVDVDVEDPVVTVPQVTLDQWGNKVIELTMSGLTNFPTATWSVSATDNVGVTNGPACWLAANHRIDDSANPVWNSSTQSYDFTVVTNPSGTQFPVSGTSISCVASDAAGNNGEYDFVVRVTHDDPTGFVQMIDKPGSFKLSGDQTSLIWYSENWTQGFSPLKPIADLFTSTNVAGMIARDAEWTLLGGAITINDDANGFYARMSGDGYDREIAKPLANMLTDSNMSGMLERNNSDRSWTVGDNTITISDIPGNFAAMVKICQPSGSGGTSCGEHHLLKPFADMLTSSTMNEAMFNRANLRLLDAGGPAAATPGSSVDTTPPVLVLPSNIYLSTTSSSGTTGTYQNSTATDNFGITSGPTCSPASGSNFPIGITTVTCTATDVAGNEGTGTFTVTVVLEGATDTTLPTLTASAYVNATSPTGRTLAVTGSDSGAVVEIYKDGQLVFDGEMPAGSSYQYDFSIMIGLPWQNPLPADWASGTYDVTWWTGYNEPESSTLSFTVPALPATAAEAAAAEAAEEEIVIPSWIKNNAGWWASNQIDDRSFVSGLQWLISNGIMNIPPTEQGAGSDDVIPGWIKNNAGWWADDLIDDRNFVTGLQWLITNGIMIIELE